MRSASCSRWGACGWLLLLGFRSDPTVQSLRLCGLSTGYPVIVVGGHVDPMVGKGGGQYPIPGSPGRTGRRAAPDEFAVIERLRVRFEAGGTAWPSPDQAVPPPGDTWIGDDAAVVIGRRRRYRCQGRVDHRPGGRGGPLRPRHLRPRGRRVEGPHGRRVRPGRHGGLARYALVSVAAPPGTDLDLLGRGLATAAEVAECVVVGGDLSEAPTLVVSVSRARHAARPAPAGRRCSGREPARAITCS